MEAANTLDVELAKQSFETLRALAWPAVLIGIAIWLRRPIRDLLDRIDVAKVSKDGVEISIGPRVAAALAAAQSEYTQQAGPDAEPGNQTSPAQSAAQVIKSSNLRRLAGKRLLWVDDIPQNNRFLVEAFSVLGIEVELATSTEQALDLLRAKKFDVSITDLTRGSDSNAGLNFIKAAKALQPSLPIFVHSSSRGRVQYGKAEEYGAHAATPVPKKLFDLVVGSLSI